MVDALLPVVKLLPAIKTVYFSIIENQWTNTDVHPHYQVNLTKLCNRWCCQALWLVCDGFYLFVYVKGWYFFVYSLNGLPLMCVSFWFNTYSITKLFFFLPLWRGLLGWEKIFFPIIFSQLIQTCFMGTFCFVTQEIKNVWAQDSRFN